MLPTQPLGRPSSSSSSDAGAMGQGIGLGSNPVQGYHDYSPDQVPGARMESGLDNSPMYDCKGPTGVCSGKDCPACTDLFDAETGQMQLIDIGKKNTIF